MPLTAAQVSPQYKIQKADQKLTESLTRVFLEDYKEISGTTELPADSWKNKYKEIRANIESGNLEGMIAALTEILTRHKHNKTQTINHGVVSIQVAANCKRLLEIKAAYTGEVKPLKDSEEDLTVATSKLKLSENEKEQIINRLTVQNHSGSERAVINYEMYERAGSLKNLQAELERQTGLKLKTPEIQVLSNPSIYREMHVYCGRRIWFNIQILPFITIQVDADPKK